MVFSLHFSILGCLAMIRIGIDLGGTKIEAIVLNEQGHTLFRERVPTPKDSYEATLEAIVGLVRKAAQSVHSKHRIAVDISNADETGIGLATPGALSLVTGLIKNANSTCLNGQPLDKDLEKRLGRAVKLANDANCLVVSEAHDGAAAGAKVVFGVILGTGVGGGFVINGLPIVGANAVAGEWGHNPLPQFRAKQTVRDDNPNMCYCGQAGCIETWLSGPGFARTANIIEADGGVAKLVAKVIDSHEIIKRMRAGDSVANVAFDNYVDRLARALASVINLIDPDVIVLGGGLSHVDELYDRVPQQWGRYVFSDEIRTKLVKNVFGDSSGVRGAAWL
jgi:fructokinase